VPTNKTTELEEILLQSWQHYQYYKIAPDGRPMADLDLQDLSEGSRGHFLTFSETVSYVLFRAVIMKDQKTFRRVWKWTYENIWRIHIKKVFYWHENKWKALPEAERDHLFCWRYTPNIKNSGRGGVIYYEWQFETADDIWRDGHEVAPDGDELIAGSLIMADELWGSAKGIFNYKDHAKKILDDLWKKSVIFHNPLELINWQDPSDSWFSYHAPSTQITHTMTRDKKPKLSITVKGSEWAGVGKTYEKLNLSLHTGLALQYQGPAAQLIIENAWSEKLTFALPAQKSFKKFVIKFNAKMHGSFLKQIKTIMFQPAAGVWQLSSLEILGIKNQGEYHLTSNAKGKVWINLSYYMPFLYQKVFPKADKGHPWKKLIEASESDFHKSFSLNSFEQKMENKKILPPDWFMINAENKIDAVPFLSPFSPDAYLSSWDAFRTWWFFCIVRNRIPQP
jgi:endo-1,4-beta-D-glucanase Y